MNPGELIRLAVLNAGGTTIAETLYAEEMYVALNMLSGLIAQWQRKRWLVWDLTETIVLASGAASYSVGPTGAFPIARPDRIESAFARIIPPAVIAGVFVNNGGILTVSGSSLPSSPTGLLGGAYWNNGGVVSIVAGSPGTAGPGYVDLQLGLIQSREDYNRIALKSMASVPMGVFYDSAYPVGQLYFWPIPLAAAYELHIFTKATLPYVADLTTDISLPPEYVQALMYQMAVMLRPLFGLPSDPALLANARASLNTIRVANTQIPTLQMPAGLPRGRNNSGVSADVNPSFQTGWW